MAYKARMGSAIVGTMTAADLIESLLESRRSLSQRCRFEHPELMLRAAPAEPALMSQALLQGCATDVELRYAQTPTPRQLGLMSLDGDLPVEIGAERP